MNIIKLTSKEIKIVIATIFIPVFIGVYFWDQEMNLISDYGFISKVKNSLLTPYSGFVICFLLTIQQISILYYIRKEQFKSSIKFGFLFFTLTSLVFYYFKGYLVEFGYQGWIPLAPYCYAFGGLVILPVYSRVISIIATNLGLLKNSHNSLLTFWSVILSIAIGCISYYALNPLYRDFYEVVQTPHIVFWFLIITPLSLIIDTKLNLKQYSNLNSKIYIISVGLYALIQCLGYLYYVMNDAYQTFFLLGNEVLVALLFLLGIRKERFSRILAMTVGWITILIYAFIIVASFQVGITSQNDWVWLLVRIVQISMVAWILALLMEVVKVKNNKERPIS